MKKILLLTAILAISFSSCNLMDVLFDYDNPLRYDGDFDRITLDDIDGTVWQIEKRFYGSREISYPVIDYHGLSPDIDGGGFPEYTAYHYYYHFDHETVRCYELFIINDSTHNPGRMPG